MKLREIKEGQMFRVVGFASESNKVYTHSLSWNEGDPYSVLYEGPTRCYRFAHVGNVVNGELQLFPHKDIKYSDVSMRAKDLYTCVEVNGSEVRHRYDHISQCS